MDEVPEKLTEGEPLTIQELVAHLPALGEKDAKTGREIYSPAQLRNYAQGAAVLRRFRAGQVICREGEFGSTAFYLVSGRVRISIENPMAHTRTAPRFFGLLSSMSSFLTADDEDGRQEGTRQFIGVDASVDLRRSMPIAELGAGELFGEMTCRTYQPRAATVVAAEDCVLVEMLRVVLDMLVGTREVAAELKSTARLVKAPTFKGTSFKAEMDRKYRERSLESHLRSVPLFAGLDADFFEHLKTNAELVSYSKGQVICRQGEPADAFYLIRMGLVRVAQSMPGGEMVRTYLGRGDFFGEIGLLKAQARNATCSALDAVDLVRIGAEDFALMTERFPAVRARLMGVAEARIEADQAQKMPAGLQLDEFLNQGLYEAQNLLVIDLNNCTRCDACVNACADAHDGVTRLIRDGLRYDHFLVATACRSCRDPLCMTQCPVGSIRRKQSLEIVIEDWCIGCGKCAELCPYGNINMHPFEVKKRVPAPAEKTAPAAAAPAAKTAPTPAAKPAETAPAQPAAVVTASAVTPPSRPAPPAPKPAAPVKSEKMVWKKMEVNKATTCDLCTQVGVPSCVYACPHDAAKRVEPSRFFATQIGRRQPGWRRWNPFGRPARTRTTH
jgi:CRP-like cAMP-binding protein/Fe-S-cluster-containing hydrogenase component 2